MLKIKEKVFSKAFGSTELEFSYVDEVMTIHIMLITKTLFETEYEEFQKILMKEDRFYKMILESILYGGD